MQQKGPFVIVMFDPDVPATEKPSIRDFIGSDFYVDRQSSVLKNRTAAIASWRRPSPPRRSQQERYVFLMYKQPLTFNNTVNLDNTTFRNFDVADYALKNGLSLPIAGTFLNIESNASCWRDGCK
ncbi:phosphatidylethanolamine-binding protein [Panaeolus papilionaceus]|nr:phosphatidylethanolamine-binding protein [Panaeolus papilionaceus]